MFNPLKYWKIVGMGIITWLAYGWKGVFWYYWVLIILVAIAEVNKQKTKKKGRIK